MADSYLDLMEGVREESTDLGSQIAAAEAARAGFLEEYKTQDKDLTQQLGLALAAALPALFSKGRSAEAGLGAYSQAQKDISALEAARKAEARDKLLLSKEDLLGLTKRQEGLSDITRDLGIREVDAKKREKERELDWGRQKELEGIRTAGDLAKVNAQANAEFNALASLYGPEKAKELVAAKYESTAAKNEAAMALATLRDMQAALLGKTMDSKVSQEAAKAEKVRLENELAQETNPLKREELASKIRNLDSTTARRDALLPGEITAQDAKEDLTRAQTGLTDKKSRLAELKAQFESETMEDRKRELLAEIAKINAGASLTEAKTTTEQARPALMEREQTRKESAFKFEQAIKERLTNLKETESSLAYKRSMEELEAEFAKDRSAALAPPSEEIKELFRKNVGIVPQTMAEAMLISSMDDKEKMRNGLMERAKLMASTRMGTKLYDMLQKYKSGIPGFEVAQGAKAPSEEHRNALAKAVAGATSSELYIAQLRGLIKNNGNIEIGVGDEGEYARNLMNQARAGLLQNLFALGPLANGQPSEKERAVIMSQLPEFNSVHAIQMSPKSAIKVLSNLHKSIQVLTKNAASSRGFTFVGVGPERSFPSWRDAAQDPMTADLIQEELDKSVRLWEKALPPMNTQGIAGMESPPTGSLGEVPLSYVEEE